MKKEVMSRREALQKLALGAGALLVVRGAAATTTDTAKPAAGSSAVPHLTPTDPLAVALAYHESAKAVDAKKFPNYKPEQNCSNCLQSKGKPGDPWVPCNLFPGKLVNAGGWCKVYVKRP